MIDSTDLYTLIIVFEHLNLHLRSQCQEKNRNLVIILSQTSESIHVKFCTLLQHFCLFTLMITWFDMTVVLECQPHPDDLMK